MIDGLAARIAALPRPTLLGLDVDGTLAPIVADPLAARVPPEVLDSLRTISVVLEIALITGRDVDALRVVAPLDRVWRAVEHGRVRISPTGVVHAPPVAAEALAALERFEEATHELVRQGARLERKPAARAIHTRGLTDPALAEALLERAASAGAALGLEVRRGRSVVELEAARGDKGAALGAIADGLGARSVVFAGDDLTDAPALREARRRGGLALFVTSAERPEAPGEVDAMLRGPADVAQLLGRLAALL